MLPWDRMNKGLSRLRKRYGANDLITGKKLWFISGSVTEDRWGALYQCSLNVVVGDEGIMFADSFWLPKFIVSYSMIPWHAMSSQSLHAEAFKFVVDGAEVSLFGKQVADAVRTHCPIFK